MKRLFLAIELPENVKSEIKKLLLPHKQIKWIEPQKMHLTLVFIGEVDGATEKELISAIESISFKPFQLQLKSIGHFSNKVLYLALNESSELMELQKKLKRKIQEIPINIEWRKFTPHITLSRLKDVNVNDIIQFIQENSMFKSSLFWVNEIQLYSSYRSPKGAIYNPEVAFSADSKD